MKKLLAVLFLACVPAFGALNFDNGANEQIDIDDNDSDQFHPTLSWTAFGHFRVENVATDQRSLITRDLSGSRVMLMRINTSGAIEVSQGTDSSCGVMANVLTTTTTLSTDTWYFYGLASDATNIMVYVFTLDGAVVIDGTGAATAVSDPDCLETTTLIVCFGSGHATNDEFDGDGYDCGYISQELSLNQLRTFVNNPRSAFGMFKTTDADDFYLVFTDTNSPLRDYSGNGNDGTIVGTVVVSGNPATSGR